MPTYDYECPACGTFEHFQSIKDAPLTKCPKCKKRKVHRLISTGGGIIFKGSGFWETDYNRSSDYQKKAKEETSSTTKPAETPKTEKMPVATAKSETKPETKAETPKPPPKASKKD